MAPTAPTAEVGAADFNLRLPPCSDSSVTASGAEAAFGTRQHGAVLADLPWLSEGRPVDPRWSYVAGPELCSEASRVAFSPSGFGRRQLAMASGRTVSVVDLAAPEGSQAVSSTSRTTTQVGTGNTPGPVGAVTGCLSAHLGAVTALDWSTRSPDLLATCAEDCRFLIWDVRKTKPAQALLAPASWTASVRWAALSEFLLATGHEDMVCIWDIRNASHHMSVLATGQSRVLSVDWSQHCRDRLLSVSAQHSQAASSGSIKVWDLTSRGKVHESIDIENGTPAAARFLPFGPAVLAAVERSVVCFLLPGAGRRRATVVQEFTGHTAPVSSVHFAPPVDGGEEWRIVSVSQAERSCRGWRMRLPDSLRNTLAESSALAPSSEPPPAPAAPVAAPPQVSPRTTPVLGPASTPVSARQRLGWVAEEPRGSDEDAQYLGCLARQAERLRCLDCVDEVTSFRQNLPGQGIEYQLLIEVTTANEICLRITVSLDPAAPATRAVRPTVEWVDEWAGTFDGPLAPGAIEETFKGLCLDSLESDGDRLCNCVQALDRMLLRRDGPPRLVGVGEAPPAAAPPRKSPQAREEVPMPRTCGVCWSPQGGLLSFHSLCNVAVPFPRRWSYPDLRRILKIHRERELRTLVHDGGDEHSVAACRLRSDCSVRFTPTAALCDRVEDHWWTTAMTGTLASTPTSTSRLRPSPGAALEAPVFLLEPTPAARTAADLCHHNRAAALAIGRQDLAEVWRLLATLCRGEGAAAHGVGARAFAWPFATRLVRDIMHQLFDAQETLTLAIVGVVLLCAADQSPPPPKHSQVLHQSRASCKRLSGPPRSTVEQPRPIQSWHTWSPATQGVADLAAAAKGIAMGNLQTLTLSNVQALRQLEEVPCDRLPPTPCVNQLPDADPPWEDLIPRDAATLERLLHSAHAHCDLMHRLGRFSASRALAKLLQRLDSFHELPILGAESSFHLSLQRMPSPPSSATLDQAAPLLLPPGSLSGGDNSESSTAGAAGAPRCVVCDLSVRKLYAPCWSCGHGFHVTCLRRWFTWSGRECPALGCGCRCWELCVRTAIRQLFPQRDCATIVRPCADEEDLRRVQDLPYKSLRPQFRDEVEDFTRKVYNSLRPKQIEGGNVNGPMLVQLAAEYCRTINNNGMPQIKSAWTYAVQSQLRMSLKDAVQLYRAQMNDKAMSYLPIDDAKLRDLHKDSKAKAIDVFLAPGFSEEEEVFREYKAELMRRIKQLYDHVKAENSKTSQHQCEACAEELYRRKIEANLNVKGHYDSVEQLMRDWEQVQRIYVEQTAGPAQAEVMTNVLFQRITESVNRFCDQKRLDEKERAEKRSCALSAIWDGAVQYFTGKGMAVPPKPDGDTEEDLRSYAPPSAWR